MQDDVFMPRVRVRNYKSIGSCDVALGPFTVLVGRNGAGKSNFVDALRFLVDALETSLDHAFKTRGGIDDVRRRSTGHPRNLGIQADFALPDGLLASYGFEIAARSRGGFAVKQERLRIVNPATRAPVAHFGLRDGRVESSAPHLPPVSPDRLFLVSAAGLPEFRPAWDALLSMGFYNLNPEAMKALQSPDAGELLHRDGANIASVVARLGAEREQTVDRIRRFLAQIVPGIGRFDRVQLGPRETLEFKQEVKGSEHPWKFYANSMSDGTLRALGALVAVSQPASPGRRARLVGIEEPEAALHPAAAGALMDALGEACRSTQLLVTTHSPDLLDQVDLSGQSLLVVIAEQGTTRIATVDGASQEAIRQHLYSAGELLRMDQLEPDPEDLARQGQGLLFEDEVPDADQG
jgi:predicted ATPase